MAKEELTGRKTLLTPSTPIETLFFFQFSANMAVLSGKVPKALAVVGLASLEKYCF
jgi:hypothetical protein